MLLLISILTEIESDIFQSTYWIEVGKSIKDLFPTSNFTQTMSALTDIPEVPLVDLKVKGGYRFTHSSQKVFPFMASDRIERNDIQIELDDQVFEIGTHVRAGKKIYRPVGVWILKFNQLEAQLM